MKLRELHPALYKLSVQYHRANRRLVWAWPAKKMAEEKFSNRTLTRRIFQHQSPLLRKLGDVDMRLQRNKVQNLKIAASLMDGLIIKPGETFSFWKIVGEPTAKRGFLEGLLISNGNVTSGVGGGLCQLANLLYWMFLHTPLQVTERHHHSMDIFPDSGRTIPFGTGATIFYNYVDLQAKNMTNQTFQIRIWVTDQYLKGEIYADAPLPVRFSIKERDHQYLLKKSDGRYYRSNKIYRESRSAKTGQTLGEEQLMENFSLMKYAPPAQALVHEIP